MFLIPYDNSLRAHLVDISGEIPPQVIWCFILYVLKGGLVILYSQFSGEVFGCLPGEGQRRKIKKCWAFGGHLTSEVFKNNGPADLRRSSIIFDQLGSGNSNMFGIFIPKLGEDSFFLTTIFQRG